MYVPLRLCACPADKVVPSLLAPQGIANGESASGTPYMNEYMLIIHFVPPKEDGDGRPKIALVKEFTDSAVAVKFFTEERAKAVKAKAAAATATGNSQPGA